MSAIVTVTPSAAIDQTYHLSSLRLGEVNRAMSVNTELSGKGVNVARAIALTDTTVSAVLALGPDGGILAGQPEFDGLLAVVASMDRTRVNTTLLDATGATTKINEGPIPLDPVVWSAVERLAESECRRLAADWLVISGSLPKIAGTEALVDIIGLMTMATDAGIRVAIDTAGAALDEAVAHLDLVSLLKPNAHELAELTGRRLDTIGDVVAAARELHVAGCDIVCVSMGADGALALSADGLWHATARARVINTAGAGDASLAGFLVGATRDGGVDVPAGLVLAASWGALSVSQSTTLLSDIDTAPRSVLVRDPDLGIALSEPMLPQRTARNSVWPSRFRRWS
jgi:1-phosphofructokinase